jgi:Cytochrome C biogenesis protein transmembrane region
LNVALPHLERGGSSRRYGSVFLFGVSYAVSSLSCALPVFLAVTGAASATPTFLSGVLTYVVYGLGMSMLLVVLTVALAIANYGMVRRLRALLPHVGRVSGAILVASGAYITAYWATNLRDPLAARGAAFRFVERPSDLAHRPARQPAPALGHSVRPPHRCRGGLRPVGAAARQPVTGLDPGAVVEPAPVTVAAPDVSHLTGAVDRDCVSGAHDPSEFE